jgi:endonuclease/exonuclease/phosphatase family metal-dependent hydrolase
LGAVIDMKNRVISGALVAIVLGGCALPSEDEGTEPTAEAAQDVTSGRCASARPTTTVRLKVMTLNLRNKENEWERRFEMIADEIDRLDPDLIGLQEVEIAKDQSDRLNDLLEKRGHGRYAVYDKRKSGFLGLFNGEGISVMSRWPIVEKTHEDTGEMRVSIVARVKHPSGGFIDMTNTHLDYRGGAEGDANRSDQARQTVDLVKRTDDCWPTFLTGDMNTTEPSAALERFTGAGFVDSFKAVHGANTARLGATNPIRLREGAGQNPTRRIDYVYGRSAGGRTVRPVDSIVCLKNHDAKGFYPSDHLAVMTTFEVKI